MPVFFGKRGLKNMKKIQQIKPSFYDKFHCIGADCKKNCCQEWSVIIYKEEFKKLKKNIKSENLKTRLPVFNKKTKCLFHTSKAYKVPLPKCAVN